MALEYFCKFFQFGPVCLGLTSKTAKFISLRLVFVFLFIV